MSELAKYHVSSPNLSGACLNTDLQEDGIVFPGVEDIRGQHGFCFIGRTSIIEAVAVLYGVTPEVVKSNMTQDPRSKNQKIADLEAQHEEDVKLLTKYRKMVSELADVE